LGIEKTLSEIIDIPTATDNSATETLFEMVDIPTTPLNAASDWLDETFGGIPGNIAEFLLEVKAGNDFTYFSRVLFNRIHALFFRSCTGSSEKEKALVWIKQITCLDVYNWISIRDCGICGFSPPNGIILRNLLDVLFFYYKYDALEAQIQRLCEIRSQVANAAFNGFLLELEVR